eukprot:14938991-Alexandrium_andersonii.AAC.1
MPTPPIPETLFRLPANKAHHAQPVSLNGANFAHRTNRGSTRFSSPQKHRRYGLMQKLQPQLDSGVFVR